MVVVPGFTLHGIAPPLVTPFCDDERIDYGAWQRIIDSLVSAGVEGLLVCGSTGEFPALDAEERIVALRFCAPGREMAVFVGPESLLLQGLECGCAGGAATGINVAPKLFVDLYRGFRQGQREAARRSAAGRA
jgi:dihydrodipicolinate synthase/N-acetylneuraminate lyase